MRLDDELWHLLHALDDPDNLEFPAGYDHRRTRGRFEQELLHIPYSTHTPVETGLLITKPP